MSERPKCIICGEPMPEGEEMFKFHGYSGNCPKPPLPKSDTQRTEKESKEVSFMYEYQRLRFTKVVDADFAKQLERENQQLREEIERLSKEKT